MREVQRSFVLNYGAVVVGSILFLIALGLLLGWCIAARAADLPMPRLEGLTSDGYVVGLCGDCRPPHWHGVGWAEHDAAHLDSEGVFDKQYPNRDWRAVISMRAIGKGQRHKSVEDCERWLDRVDKALAKTRGKR